MLMPNEAVIIPPSTPPIVFRTVNIVKPPAAILTAVSSSSHFVQAGAACRQPGLRSDGNMGETIITEKIQI